MQNLLTNDVRQEELDCIKEESSDSMNVQYLANEPSLRMEERNLEQDVEPVVSTEDIKVALTDNAGSLAATIFYPLEESQLKGAVMIAPATGVRRYFYTAFAQYLATHGFAVLTFDNSGIGGSLRGPLKQSTTRLQDWGQQDMPAILAELMQRFSNTSYHLIGHSAGGQLIGLMPNAHYLSSVFNYACSSGSLRNMKGFFSLQAQFFMNVYIPLNNRVFGLTRTDWVGMGEPLPRHVAQQWATWCKGRGYAETAFGKTIQMHNYDAIKCPSLWVTAVDDDIACSLNVDDMIRVYSRMPAQRIDLQAVDYGFKEIGHMNFFRRAYSVLWPLALDWLNTQSTQGIERPD